MTMSLWLGAQLLILLGAANIAPILAKRLLGTRGNAPIDGGARFFDGRPLLGPSKTWRGLAAAVGLTALTALALGHAAGLGASIGAAAMAGDLLSSFIKRRVDIASSGKATGLDQVPEALLPLLAVQGTLQLSATMIVVVTLVFFALALPLARWSHRIGLRDQPH
jgi:CDP-2,3-bis-(O-geranylgeranyl)-sn-glycerol synthase